jgi:hypothetical protein
MAVREDGVVAAVGVMEIVDKRIFTYARDRPMRGMHEKE